MNTADVVLKNGRILSIGLDGKRIEGTAVAIKDGLIAKVGDDEDIKAYIGTSTELIDCGQNTIMPGMCDAHCHPSISASLYVGCNLFGLYIKDGQKPQEITDQYMERLSEFISQHKDDEIIKGIGWVKGNYPEDCMPTRHDIDKVCSDRPVVLESFCQHNLWVNTKALELAGIDADYPDPVAGIIYREADGYPAGVFSEPEAIDPLKERVPGYDYTVAKYKESFKQYQRRDANKYGVTMVQDCMYSDNAREAYKELAKEGSLTLRARGVYMLSAKNRVEEMKSYVARKGADNIGDSFRTDTIKIFAEGPFVLLEPYEGEFIEEFKLPPGATGEGFWSDDELTDSIAEGLKGGFDIHIHAMGDKSVKQAADCLAEGQQRAGVKGRNVIAHLMLVDDESAEIMGKNKIIANCQPRWMVYDSDIAAGVFMLGKERAEASYPYRKLLDNGVTVAFGTDFPVTPPPNTFHEIQCAMTRTVFPDAPDYEQFKGKRLGSERAASLSEAIKSITINGAYQMNMDHIAGSIEEGKSADLLILNSNLETMPVDKIYTVEVSKTLFKGRIVYDSAEEK